MTYLIAAGIGAVGGVILSALIIGITTFIVRRTG